MRMPEAWKRSLFRDEELAEDTPHFLNPEVLRDEIDFVGEERTADTEAISGEERERSGGAGEQKSGHAANQQFEDILNQGIGFLSGVMEMATGEKLACADGSEKMVTVDKTTGEVTLKFRLPGLIKKE